MSKGSPIVRFRISSAELAELEGAMHQVNARRKGEPYTLSSFLLSCVRERMDKLERGRKAGRKKGQAAAQPDQADDCLTVVPETPEEVYRAAWHVLAEASEVDALDSAEYRRVAAHWDQMDRPIVTVGTLRQMASNVLAPRF